MRVGLFAEEGPKHVSIRTSEKLSCQVCGGDRFFSRKAPASAVSSPFSGLGLEDSTAHCYVCSRCGYVHWFLGPEDEG